MARQMLDIEKADTPISRYPVIKAFYQGDAPTAYFRMNFITRWKRPAVISVQLKKVMLCGSKS
uniref:Uncharacterized protein n=1 Tax=Rheinheimera sp. BAL341 TaxID=1708203 RepID=A0A486XTF6_9GAMM